MLSPYIAQLADRFGQRNVLLIQVAIFTIASVSFIGLADLRAPFGVLLATGAVAGGFMPSTGNMVRTRWSGLLSDDQHRLHAAFALESVNDELIFVIGPALVTLLATQVAPVSGIGTAAGLAIIGTTLFALQRRTEPAPRPRPERRLDRSRRPSLPARRADHVVAGVPVPRRDVRHGGSQLGRVRHSARAPAAGRVILGTYALGSAIGGFWYGTRNWRAPVGRRFITTAVLVVAGAIAFIFMPNLPVARRHLPDRGTVHRTDADRGLCDP